VTERFVIVRLDRLERSVAATRELVTRMYQTFYAAQVRRANTYGRMLERIKANAKSLEKHLPMYTRLARMSVSLSKGKSLVALDARQLNQLRELLKRRRPFKTRG
jgi:hypothetical protein